MSYIKQKPGIYHDGRYLGPGGSETLSKPETVRRAKPPDLFAASTGRVVSWSDVTNTKYVRYPGSGSVPSTYGVLYAGREYTADFSSAHSETRGKLLDKIKRQNVNLAQAMIEFRQSVDLFHSLATELYGGWKAVRRGHILKKGFFSKDKQLSKKWIEYQFGILPLVSDLQGLCDSLADSLRDGSYIHVTQRGGDVQTYSRTKVNSEGTGTIFQFEKHSIRIRLDARYLIKDSLVDDVTRFGFFNAPALGWELVPFSFVVDWMFDVGGWLGRLDALNGVKDLSYIQNTYTEIITETSSSNGGLATSRHIVKARTMNQKVLSAGYPRYDPSFSLRRLMTATSLLHLVGR